MLAVPARKIQRALLDLKIFVGRAHHPADAGD
jgi:hypothetical protein